MTTADSATFSPHYLREKLHTVLAERPDDPALITPTVRLSNRHLVDQVDARAAVLLSVTDLLPGQFLPVIVDYSLDALVTVLACMTSRIPFSPIDPETPPIRRDRLWELLGSPTVFVGSPELSGRVFSAACEPINLDHTSVELSKFRAVDGQGDALAILTSGSTGTPKGVVLSYEVLDHRIDQAIESLRPQEGPGVVTSFSPLHFIGGLRQVGMIFGGKALFRARPVEWHPRELLGLIRDADPTHLSLPAQLARVLGRVAYGSNVFFPRVAQITMGAEPIFYEFLTPLRGSVPDHTMVRHSLGSTEASGSFVHHFSLSRSPKSGRVPIGEPVTDGSLRLEQWDADLPEVAEVWRSGAIASRYLGDPSHNENRFEVDTAGVRWWKSGDLVTRGEDGHYFHHGRSDDVVKVKGKLASPTETMSALMALPGVGRAVVLPDLSGGSTILVAHVEPAPGSQISASFLRAALSETLPAHLVPARILCHDLLPVTGRGKVDRRALKKLHFK